VAQHPEIDLDIDFTDRMVDIIEEGFDVVIRGGELPNSEMMSRRLAPFRFVLCASPDYLEKHGLPLEPIDLNGHRSIRFRFTPTGKLQEWSLSNVPADFEPRLVTALTCTNLEAIETAAISGYGIAYMPDFLVRDRYALVRSSRYWMTISAHAAISGSSGVRARTCPRRFVFSWISWVASFFRWKIEQPGPLNAGSWNGVAATRPQPLGDPPRPPCDGPGGLRPNLIGNATELTAGGIVRRFAFVRQAGTASRSSTRWSKVLRTAIFLPAVAASLLEEYEAHLHAPRLGAEENQAPHTT
jgi:hypothetical protein